MLFYKTYLFPFLKAMYQTARDGYAVEINAKPISNVNTLMPYNAHMKESSVSDRSDLESDFEFQDDIQSSECMN